MSHKNKIIEIILFILCVVLLEIFISTIPVEEIEEEVIVVPQEISNINKIKRAHFQIAKWHQIAQGTIFPLPSTADKIGACSYRLSLEQIHLDNAHLQEKGVDLLSPVRVFEKETSLQPIKSQKFFGDECIGASAFVNGQLYFSPTNPDISLSELSLGYVPNGKENAHSEPAYWLFNNALYVVRMRRRKIFCEQTSCADPEEVMLTISLTAVSHVKLPSFIMLNRQKFDVDHIEENQYQVAFPLKNTGQRISLRIRANADFIVNDIVLSSEDVAVSILNSKKL